MATPTIFTPFDSGQNQLTTALATYKTIGSGGGILDHILLSNTGPVDVAKAWQNILPGSTNTFNDRTAAANNTALADITMFTTTSVADGDVFYISSAAQYSGVVIILSTVQAGGTTMDIAYGSAAGTPGTYTSMTAALHNVVDGTNLMKTSGEITWNNPSGFATPWVTTTPVAPTAGYFLRLKFTAGTLGPAPIGTQIRIGTLGGVATSVYHVPSAGSALDSNAIAKNIVIPGDGRPLNLIRDLMGRPYHMAASSFIQAVALQPQVTIRIGGVDYV